MRTALGFGGSGAEEDVFLVAIEIESLGRGLEEVGHFSSGL